MAVNPGSISAQPAAASLTGAEVLPLDQAVGSPVAATALVVGQGYRIVSLGNTNWTAAGAGATPAVGTVFSCTAVGAGSGTAQRIDTRRATAQEIAARALQDPTAAPTFAGLTVSGTATATQFDGDLTGAVSEHCRNTSGLSLAALTPLYVTGSQGDTTILEVVAARGDTPGRMPAAGLALAAMGTSGNAAAGHLVAVGPIAGVNTAGLFPGAPLFVGLTGGTTATMPATGLVQVVAVVGRVHATTGTVIALPGPALSLAAFTGAYGDLSGRPGEISQAEAEEGTGTAFRLWSAARWRQAVAAWWTSITGATGRSLTAAATPAAGRSTLELGSAALAAATDFANDYQPFAWREDTSLLAASSSIALLEMPWSMTEELYALPRWTLVTAPTGGSCQFDIQRFISGSWQSIYSVLPTIASGQTSSDGTSGTFTTAFAASPVITASTRVRHMCLQIGPSTAGAGLRWVVFTRTVYG